MDRRYTRLAPNITPEVDSVSRVVHYIISDESVGRDDFIVRTSAWNMDNFGSNPVFLWAHDDTQPPIGRVFDLHAQGRTLKGSVRYAETEFADTIYQLVKARFLSATSTSWMPLPGGVEYPANTPGVKAIFTNVDLLEVSQVNVPALSTALVDARARGINMRPLARWAERALDTGNYTGPPRREIEALYRAARGATKLRGEKTVSHSDPGRAARVEFVRKLRRAARDPLTSDQETELKGAQMHLRSAQRRRAQLARHHEATIDQIDEARALCRSMSHTLEEIEPGARTRMARHLDDLQRCVRAVNDSHKSMGADLDDLADSHQNARKHVDKVVDGYAENDDEDDDDQGGGR